MGIIFALGSFCAGGFMIYTILQKTRKLPQRENFHVNSNFHVLFTFQAKQLKQMIDMYLHESDRVSQTKSFMVSLYPSSYKTRSVM